MGIPLPPHLKAAELGAKFTKETLTKPKNLLRLGAAGVILSAGAYGAWTGVMDHLPALTHETLEVEAGRSDVLSIDLNLAKKTYTASTIRTTSKAEYAVGVGPVKRMYFKNNEVTFVAENSLSMEGNTANATLDTAANHIDVHIDSDAIMADIAIVEGSVQSKPDENLIAAWGENMSNTLRATPLISNLGMVEGFNGAIDSNNDALENVAIVYGLKSAADTCTPKVWPVSHEAFINGVKDGILLGAQLYDDDLTRDDVTVLIGDATTEAENVNQKIGVQTSVDDTYNKIADSFKGKDNFTMTTKPGTCELSDEVKQSLNETPSATQTAHQAGMEVSHEQ